MIYSCSVVMDVYATDPARAANEMMRLLKHPGNKLPIVHVKEPKSGFEGVYDTSKTPPEKVA